MKNDYLSKMKDLETREREMSLREKEGKRLSSNFKSQPFRISFHPFLVLQRDSEKAGLARRKEIDELRVQYDEKLKEIAEKNARLQAQNSRYKTENERLEKLYQATKNENVKLNEQIDNLIKNTKRKEGNTWKEINRIVEQATKPATSQTVSPFFREKLLLNLLIGKKSEKPRQHSAEIYAKAR